MSKIKGRPRGSEKDDSRALNAMADMLHADPALKATTAIRRHNPKAGDAEIRRLQVKWKERKEVLLAAAAERVTTRQSQAASANMPVGRPSLGAVTAAARMAQDIYNSPTMRAMREIQNSPIMSAMRDIQDSPLLQTIRALQNTPAMQMARAMEDLPSVRIAREQAEMLRRLGL